MPNPVTPQDTSAQKLKDIKDSDQFLPVPTLLEAVTVPTAFGATIIGARSMAERWLRNSS
jgi:hypothetical protein